MNNEEKTVQQSILKNQIGCTQKGNFRQRRNNGKNKNSEHKLEKNNVTRFVVAEKIDRTRDQEMEEPCGRGGRKKGRYFISRPDV